MRPKQKHTFLLIVLITFSMLLTWLGFRGLAINQVPAYYPGGLFLIVAVGHLFGVNVWLVGLFKSANDKPS
jgi:hypothetical protein